MSFMYLLKKSSSNIAQTERNVHTGMRMKNTIEKMNQVLP